MGERLIRIEQHGGIGLIWLAGRLFTIGFLNSSFWKSALALLIWPYYVCAELAPAAEIPSKAFRQLEQGFKRGRGPCNPAPW